MLLDLFAAGVAGQDISISSACHGSGAPCTTALGWIGKLESARLIFRVSDSSDRRRTFVRLTEEGAALVSDWLANLCGSPVVPLD